MVNRRLIGHELLNNGDYLRMSIKRILNDLCENEKGSLSKLQCLAYEMKDHCGDDLECLSSVTLDILPPNFRECQNPNFSSDLDNIGNAIGDPMILKHVRVSREIRPIKDIDLTVSSAADYKSIGFLISIPLVLSGLYLRRFNKKSSLKTGLTISCYLLGTLLFYLSS